MRKSRLVIAGRVSCGRLYPLQVSQSDHLADGFIRSGHCIWGARQVPPGPPSRNHSPDLAFRLRSRLAGKPPTHVAAHVSVKTLAPAAIWNRYRIEESTNPARNSTAPTAPVLLPLEALRITIEASITIVEVPSSAAEVTAAVEATTSV